MDSAGGLGRRRVVGLCAATGLGVPLLSACGGDSPEPEPTSPGTVLAEVSEVPVGGGVVTGGVVVTQPTEGEFRAFSGTCTHQGCQVGSVDDGLITCGCHGSAFSVVDGSVANGPATSPLPEIEIAVEGGEITRA